MEIGGHQTPQQQEVATLYGISVGPGDPELITLKGLRHLQQVAVVAFPKGVNTGQSARATNALGVAQAIVAQWIKADQIQLPLAFPYVHDDAELSKAWHMAAEQVWTYLQRGQDVGFVCEGDISFYSTFTYLAQTLQQIHPEAKIERIPGVCSPMAVASALGLPLTVRSQRLTILPALYSVDELDTALTHSDIVVLMKMGSVYHQVWSVLQRRSLLQHSYVIEWATHPQQTIYRDLRDRPHLSLSYFSIMVIQAHPNG